MANNNRIQILRGSKDYDPATSEVTLKDGQLFYSKKTEQLYIGDGQNLIKDLKPIGGKEQSNGKFSRDIYTAFSIGSITASPSNRQILFKKDETFEDAFDRIFDTTTQPKVTQPKLTISVSPSSVSGEYGSNWPQKISVTTSTSNGSYEFGPADTGVTWNDDLSVTENGNSAGVIGSGNRRYTATQSYTASGVIALDSKGKPSNPEKKIESGSDTATTTIAETALYRQFYGNVSGETIEEILSNLKNVTNTNSGTDLYSLLQNSNPSEIKVTLNADGYIYFITKNTINGASMGGYEFPIRNLGSGYFTNQYGKQYNVNVYRSSSQQTAGTYNISLS